jgi:hypothetical protein
MGDGFKHVCGGCRHHVDDCTCKENDMSDNVVPGPGSSESINDPGAFDEPTPDVPENEAATDEPTVEVAIGVHIMFLQDGQFGIQATGNPNLGELHMLVARALASLESRMVAETVAQVMGERKSESRIITPGRKG